MKNFTVIDSHCDTLTSILESNNRSVSENFDFSLKDTLLYDGYLQFFAAWIDKQKGDPYTQAIRLIDCFYDMINKNSCCVMPVFSSADILNAFMDKKTGALLAIEGAEAIKGSLENLELFHNKGVRSICLMWNYRNEIGIPAYDTDALEGLSKFGKQVVRKMNDLNMLIDVSHLNEKGFYDVLEISSKPFIASHSCSYDICPHPRNLKDDQFKELIKTGGVVGINFYPPFLSETKEASVKDIVKHILHFLDLGGENNIGIGSDFDGVDYLPVDLKSNKDIAKIAKSLYDEGVSEDIIDKIMWKNTFRLLSEILV